MQSQQNTNGESSGEQINATLQMLLSLLQNRSPLPPPSRSSTMDSTSSSNFVSHSDPMNSFDSLYARNTGNPIPNANDISADNLMGSMMQERPTAHAAASNQGLNQTFLASLLLGINPNSIQSSTGRSPPFPSSTPNDHLGCVPLAMTQPRAMRDTPFTSPDSLAYTQDPSSTYLHEAIKHLLQDRQVQNHRSLSASMTANDTLAFRATGQCHMHSSPATDQARVGGRFPSSNEAGALDQTLQPLIQQILLQNLMKNSNTGHSQEVTTASSFGLPSQIAHPQEVNSIILALLGTDPRLQYGSSSSADYLGTAVLPNSSKAGAAGAETSIFNGPSQQLSLATASATEGRGAAVRVEGQGANYSTVSTDALISLLNDLLAVKAGMLPEASTPCHSNSPLDVFSSFLNSTTTTSLAGIPNPDGSLLSQLCKVAVPTEEANAVLNNQTSQYLRDTASGAFHSQAKNNMAQLQEAAKAESFSERSSSQEEALDPSNQKNRKRNQPKRPLTPYNIFFKEQRMKILAERDHASESAAEAISKSDWKRRKGRSQPHHKISFQELGKMIGKRWREIDSATMAEYERRAEEDRRRYQDEVGQLLLAEREERDRKRSKDDK